MTDEPSADPPTDPVSYSLHVRVTDRSGALERLLGLLRRKAMKLRADRIVREGRRESWGVVLTPIERDAPMERYAHEIGHLVDVEEITRIPGPTTPSPSPATPASSGERSERSHAGTTREPREEETDRD